MRSSSPRFLLACGLSLLWALFTSPLEAAPPVHPAEPLYNTYCSSCHGVTGLGDGKTSQLFQPQLRPLHQAIAGQKDEDILTVLEKGKGQMPGWENVLKQDQRQQLLDYIKTFQKKLDKTP